MQDALRVLRGWGFSAMFFGALVGDLGAQSLGRGTVGQKENLDLPYGRVVAESVEGEALDCLSFFGGSFRGDAFFLVID